MNAPEMFCPLCSAYVNVTRAAIITIRRHPRFGVSHEMNLARVITCEECAIVSEINPRTGELIDLGNITVADIMLPVERARVFASVNAVPLMHGRES